MKVPLFVLLCGFALSGCMHYGTRSGTGDSLPDTESIRYTLPYTHAKVTATLTLKSCGSPTKAAGEITIIPVAAPSSVPEEQFVISGRSLKSFARDRDVSVTLHENRTLKTVNASTTDKSAAIIGNVIKLATLFLAPSKPGELRCTPKVKTALDRVAALQAKISTLRVKQYDPDHDDDEDVAKTINAFAAEVARLNTGPLQVKLSKTIAIHPGIAAGYVTWKERDFRKWIEDPSVTASKPQPLLADVTNFKLRYCTWKADEDGSDCPEHLPKNGANDLACRQPEADRPQNVVCTDVAEYKPDTVDCGQCPDTLVFREPVSARFVVVSDSDNLIRPKDTTLATKSMAINQWGKVATLPMSVGFGGSKTLSVTLDPFGQRTAFGWKSGATGEAVTGALSSIGEQYVGFRDRDDGASLKEITNEATYLEALQKLNRLEACKEIIENGGYECPESN